MTVGLVAILGIVSPLHIAFTYLSWLVSDTVSPAMIDSIGLLVFFGLVIYEMAFWSWAVARLSQPEDGFVIARRLVTMILLGALARFAFYFVLMLRSLEHAGV